MLALNLFGLGYPLTPERVARIRATEERLAPWLALYAVEGGQAVGQVGVMRVSLETRDGPEEFGALWAVCTRPDWTGRGVATSLIGEAHRRMREWGLSAVTEEERGLINDLYSRAVAGRLGFTHRSPRFAEAAVAAGDVSGPVGDVSRGGLLLLRDGREAGSARTRWAASGYVVAEVGPEVVRVVEAVVLPDRDLAGALAAVRAAYPERAVLYRGVLSGRVNEALGRAGFVHRGGGNGVIMAACLGPQGPEERARGNGCEERAPGSARGGELVDLDRLRDRQGVGEESFLFGGLDAT